MQLTTQHVLVLDPINANCHGPHQCQLPGTVKSRPGQFDFHPGLLGIVTTRPGQIDFHPGLHSNAETGGISMQADRQETLSAIGEDLFTLAVDQPFRFPAAFTFVLRAFTTLEGIGRSLDPEFQFSEVAKPYASELLQLKVHGLAFPFLPRRLSLNHFRPCDLARWQLRSSPCLLTLGSASTLVDGPSICLTVACSNLQCQSLGMSSAYVGDSHAAAGQGLAICW